MSIPRYNGGLFDPERYKFLEENKAGDDILSEVIYELSYRTDKTGKPIALITKGLGKDILEPFMKVCLNTSLALLTVK